VQGYLARAQPPTLEVLQCCGVGVRRRRDAQFGNKPDSYGAATAWADLRRELDATPGVRAGRRLGCAVLLAVSSFVLVLVLVVVVVVVLL
jgi:hypothetical protein